MMALNNLLASPSFESWREGEPLDVERMLRAPDGRPRLSIVSTAHLADEERALRDRAPPRQGEDLDAAPGRDDRAARARLHGRDLRLLPAPPGEPAHQAAAADPAQAGARAGRRRRPRHPEPGGPRLQGPRQHGHLDGGDAADAAGPRAAARAGSRARGSRPRRWRSCSPRRRSASSCCTTCTARPRASCSRAGRCPTCAGRSRATRSRASSKAKPAGRPRRRRRGRRRRRAGPPVLPPPFRHLYLARRTAARSPTAHLLVKYAVRYKGLDEVVGVRAWPLAGATPADTLEAEPVEVDEASVGRRRARRACATSTRRPGSPPRGRRGSRRRCGSGSTTSSRSRSSATR